jgi:hypothetical protein
MSGIVTKLCKNLIFTLKNASRYGLESPGIETRWGGEIFRTRPDRPGAHPAPYTLGTGSLSWG